MSWLTWICSTGLGVSAPRPDSWLAVLRARNPCFELTDPPFRNSQSIALAFAATGSRPAALLASPRHRIGASSGPPQPGGVTDTGSHEIVPVRIDQHPLAAMAVLAGSDDLPRQLQQLLFYTADGITL